MPCMLDPLAHRLLMESQISCYDVLTVLHQIQLVVEAAPVIRTLRDAIEARMLGTCSPESADNNLWTRTVYLLAR